MRKAIFLFSILMGFVLSFSYAEARTVTVGPGPASNPAVVQPVIPTFFSLYGNDTNQSVFSDVEPTQDGGYVAVGLTLMISIDRTDGWIVKVNKEGEVQWQTTHRSVVGPNTFYDGFGEVIETDSGDFIVVGEYGATGNPWFLKYDANGNLIQQRTLEIDSPSDPDLSPVSLIRTTDGFYAIGGNTTGFASDPAMVKFDENLNVLWQRQYKGFETERMLDFIATSDGGYLGVGYIDPDFDQAMIFKLSALGLYQWQIVVNHPTSLHNFTLNAAIETSDGNFLVAGRYWIIAGPPHQGLSIKVDPSGNLLWIKSYGTSAGHVGFNDVVETVNNNYAYTGSFASDSHIVVTKPNGQIVTQRAYDMGSLESIAEINLADDGGLIAAGSVYQTENNGALWKVLKNGSIQGGCSVEVPMDLQVSTPDQQVLVTDLLEAPFDLLTDSPDIASDDTSITESRICGN